MKNMKGASVMCTMKKYLSLLLILALVLVHAPLSALAESGLGESSQLETEEDLDIVLDDDELEDEAVEAQDPEEDELEALESLEAELLTDCAGLSRVGHWETGLARAATLSSEFLSCAAAK